jgi:hypothetical protein
MLLFRYFAEIRHSQKKLLGWAGMQRVSYGVSSASAFHFDLVCAKYDILLIYVYVCMYK